MSLGALSRFFEYKIAALLHDPVDKAWVIVRGRSHEEVALAYATRILSGVGLAERIESVLRGVRKLRSQHVVGYADALASSIDRWVISILTTYRGVEGKSEYIGGAFEVKQAGKLKNIVDPRFYTALDEPKEEVNEFVKVLGDLLVIAKGDLRLVYHLLYALYEPVFYSVVGSKGKGFVGSVADTRAPTHTVFDHAYATASMVNLVYGVGEERVIGRSAREKIDGYIVVVDLAGVQKFISASRKLRDLWVSSWLASALAWATVWPLVYALGPDVMVSPSPRNNPFYYSMLLAVLKSKVKNVGEIEKYFTKAVGSENKDIPRFGVMPTQVILLLPRFSVIASSLREVVEEKVFAKEISEVIRKDTSVIREDGQLIAKLIVDVYRVLWKIIVDEVKEFIVHGSSESELLKALRKILVDYNYWDIGELEKAFEVIKDYPPLPIRVVVLRVRDILAEAGRDVEEYEVYDVIVNRALDELRKTSLLKYSYPPAPPIEELYKLVREVSQRGYGRKGGLSRRGFEYCSVCGLMPAVLRMPSTNEWQDWSSNLEKENISANVIEPFLSPGERLCIYDLIKRVLTVNEVFNNVVERILHEKIGKISLDSFPSTSHISTIDFYEKLVEVYKKAHEEDILEELDEELSKVVGSLLMDTKSKPSTRSKSAYKYLEKQRSDLKKVLGDMYEKVSFDIIVSLVDPEVHLLDVEGRKKLRKFQEYVREKLNIRLPLNTYYGIIRADADNMGKLLRGYTSIALGLDPIGYLVEAIEGKIKDVVKLVIEGKIDNAKDVLVKEYAELGKVSNPVRVAEENINRLNKLLMVLKRGKIPLTPTYHAAISRSLMITALVDQHIVEKAKGFIVYSGGDDLLALAPVSTSISIALDTRRIFSIGHYYKAYDSKGFMSRELLEGLDLAYYVVPLIVTGGRSYSIVYVHYRYPLYVSLSRSHELLEEKDDVLWVIDNAKFAKDILNIAYVPRGHEIRNTILPFKQKECSIVEPIEDSIKHYWLGTVIESVQKAWKEVEEGELTRSIIYDLLKEKEVIEKLLEYGSNDMYSKFIKYVISRNMVSKTSVQEKVKELNITKLLEDYVGYKLKKEGKELSIISNLIDFFKIYHSALRGVA